jgi:hypothetical protein
VPDPDGNEIRPHWPGALSDVDVNVIGAPAVPTAESDPFTVSTRVVEFPFTTTPGSIVSVTPEVTDTFPVITNGLSATAQVVFDEIVPDTFVGPTLHAALGRATMITSAASATRRRSLWRRRTARTAFGRLICGDSLSS